MKTNYVLIDYENVQPAVLANLDQEHVKVIVFVGANQTKISFELACALQQMGARARYVKIAGNGSNALDFHLAFYLGQLAVNEPDAFFHIISNDTGFDPLIQHLKSTKIYVRRSCDLASLPLAKVAHTISADERFAIIIAKLQQHGATKPRTIKTLSNAINALFQKQLSENEVVLLVQKLQRQGIITVDDTKVFYVLPE